MRFLIDDQLPVALARWIGTQGFTATHLADAGLTGKPDTEIWAFAARIDAIVISMDEDFFDLHQRDPSGPSLVWLHWGNTRKGALLAKIAIAWPGIIQRLSAGERLVELTD
jgi:predicted nuclease of predicted toxin-antitoxin system